MSQISMSNLRVGFFVSPHFANHISQRHDVVLGQGQGFYFGQLPLHLHVGDHFPELLKQSDHIKYYVRYIKVSIFFKKKIPLHCITIIRLRSVSFQLLVEKLKKKQYSASLTSNASLRECILILSRSLLSSLLRFLSRAESAFLFLRAEAPLPW